MKILVVDHNAIDPLSRAVYRRLAKEGDVGVRLIVPEYWHDNYRMLRASPEREGEQFEVRPLPVFFPTRTHRLIYRGIGRELREYRPDILYVNAEPENFQTVQCALAASACPAARFVFSTWRNIEYVHGRFPYRFAALHAMAERTVLRRADHAVAFVPEAREIFSRLGFSHLTWIPPDIDTSVFRPSSHTGRPAAVTTTVGYAGRLHILKGVDILLRAAARLPERFRFLIVGAGPDEARLRSLCTSLGLDARVDWRHAVPRVEMPGVFNETDVIVLPSRTGSDWKEQFGRVLGEAMACGVPVIGSDSGAIPSVIGDAGQIVAEGDVGGLCDALTLIESDSRLRERCVQAGLSRVRTTYDVSVIAAQFLLLFRSLAG